MCGIAGELNWAVAPDAEVIRSMVAMIKHRGPDDQGIWRSSRSPCVLGHARLSIIDLSPAGHQPMVDPQTGNSIVFNGEIYNFQSLRRECEAQGDIFLSHSDTEVILALYRKHGIDCLQMLRGMFAFALWDEERQRLFLARDRFGKKPLNYSLTDRSIVFCSELRPLARHPCVDRQIDNEALELYLQCQFVPPPWTIYQGIRKLRPAHYAIFDRSGFRTEKYWDIDYREKVRIRESEAVDALEEKLTEAIRLRMISDVPLGALLSGGIDSSIVVAIMAKIAKEPVRTFSIGFDEEAFSELPWAERVANRFRTIHHPEIVRGDVEQLLPTLVQHYGEPYADSSAIPSFFVSATARRHVTVALNGDGGDELLGGYPRYWLPQSAVLSSSLLGGLIRPRILADLTPALSRANTIPARALRKILMQFTNPELRSAAMFSAFWNDSERRRLLPDGSPEVLTKWRREWLVGSFAHADSSIDRMLWFDNHTYLPGDLLVKMDIASMHCGLETRSPLLDHELAEFCARLPVNLKVNTRIGKYLLKKLAERYFPLDFVHRRKMGFGIPLIAWLQGPLEPVLRHTLTDPQLMAPLSPTVINTTLTEFQNGQHLHASRLWALIMYGLWRQHGCT